jgi:hypothetical protein
MPLGATTEFDRSSQPSLSLSSRSADPRGAGSPVRQYATRPVGCDPKIPLSLSCSVSTNRLTRRAKAFRGERDLTHMSHDEGEPTPHAPATARHPGRSPSTSRTPHGCADHTRRSSRPPATTRTAASHSPTSLDHSARVSRQSIDPKINAPDGARRNSKLVHRTHQTLVSLSNGHRSDPRT